jgi:hypothetical protein
VVKQILQIHAILPGQKPERQFNIPVRSSREQSSAESAPQQSVPQQSAPQQPVTQQSAPQQPAPQQTIQPQAAAAVQQTTSSQSAEPTAFQPAPVPASQNPPEDVGRSSNLDGAANLEPTRSMAKNTFSTDPLNPAVNSYGRPMAHSENISADAQAKLDQELPPSKLLNSNPAPEPRRDDRLRRKDSETQEDDEFVDAQS